MNASVCCMSRPDLPPPRLANSASYFLGCAARTAGRLAQRHFANDPLRFPHYVALCWVEHLAPCSQRDLASAMDTDPSDLVTVLGALEEAGLLRREPDPSDRRRNLVGVTDEGAKWLERWHIQAEKCDSTLCASMPDGGAALRILLGLVIGSASS